MAFRVEITPQALADLDSIAEYIAAKGSFAVAERWFNGIMDEIRALSQNSARCAHAPEAELMRADIRLLLSGKRRHRYKIYFLISPATSSVSVLHVRHWARQQVEVSEVDDGPRNPRDPSTRQDER